MNAKTSIYSRSATFMYYISPKITNTFFYNTIIFNLNLTHQKYLLYVKIFIN